ncbi:MAG: hypothetical protein ACHQ1D_03070 [Nitrososphaerales archaeon]
MKTQELLNRVDFLITKGNSALSNLKYSSYDSSKYVETGVYAGFRSASLSFISGLFGEDHTYYKEFGTQVNSSYNYNIESGVAILQSIRHEIEQGWLTSLKSIVSAEVFSDFLEMSKHLLEEKYKDPAAVMIGSVLEEHLRQSCLANSIDIEIMKGTDRMPKKADLMNSDLVKVGMYGVLEQKNITAWLDLRNRAAHGKYSEYTIEQVDLMYQGVLNFITRIR